MKNTWINLSLFNTFIKIQMNLMVLSEWLMLNANSAIFQLYHGKNKLIFNEMMMSLALY